jgi:nucleoside-diphosphate-sugar epimerase
VVSSGAEGIPVSRSVVVTGATGVVGPWLLPRLCEGGFAVQAISRRPEPESETGTLPYGCCEGKPGRVRWLSLDLAHGWPAPPRASKAARNRSTVEFGLEPAALLIHAAPIWLLPPLLPPLCDLGLRRLVAFSSTSRFTKWDSASTRERDTARRLAEAEEAVESICRDRRIAWTIFRPTLVYGGGRDRNVSAIARLVRYLGFVPVAGAALGARQPVHADDLARACLAVLDNAATFGKAYDLPGGETLTYAEMIARIAVGTGRKPRLLHLPPPALRIAIGLARLLPGFAYLSPRMADRMNEDLRFDDRPARRDFGYAPHGFVFPGPPACP